MPPNKLRSTAITLGLLALSGLVALVHNEAQDFRGGVPSWEKNEEFSEDVFTFVRIRYNSYYRERGWSTDYPDSDLNLSYRLQQLTSIEADPNGKVLTLMDDELFNYPYIYIVEPKFLHFEEAEVENLRRYLLNGGFLHVDDFWGDWEWANWEEQIRKVFPKREIVELPLSHPIFHCVFEIKEKPQIPGIGHAMNSRYTGITWEGGEDGREVHVRAIHDDKGRIMCLMTHNTDLGDGWEREGENEWFFREFSEKKAFPMGINIIFYAMTH